MRIIRNTSENIPHHDGQICLAVLPATSHPPVLSLVNEMSSAVMEHRIKKKESGTKHGRERRRSTITRETCIVY